MTKIDSYKLSHTCLIDDVSDNNLSMSRSSTNSRSRSPSLSKTSDSVDKKSVGLLLVEEAKPQKSERNLSRPNSRNKLEDNENENASSKTPLKVCETNAKPENKSPNTLSQFRKLSKQELGKTNFRSAVNEKPTLPLLIEHASNNNKQASSFVVNRLAKQQNGLLAKTLGPLLPTPTRLVQMVIDRNMYYINVMNASIQYEEMYFNSSN